MQFRAGIIALSAIAMVGCASARASDSNISTAYHGALRCYVLNGDLMKRFKDSGDGANAAIREKAAHHAYDVAMGYGNVLHLSYDQKSEDIENTTSSELRKLLDDSYLKASLQSCKSQGLM